MSLKVFSHPYRQDSDQPDFRFWKMKVVRIKNDIFQNGVMTTSISNDVMKNALFPIMKILSNLIEHDFVIHYSISEFLFAIGSSRWVLELSFLIFIKLIEIKGLYLFKIWHFSKICYMRVSLQTFLNVYRHRRDMQISALCSLMVCEPYIINVKSIPWIVFIILYIENIHFLEWMRLTQKSHLYFYS